MNVINDEDVVVRDLELAMNSYLESDSAEEAAERVVGKTTDSARAALRLMQTTGVQKFREEPESVTPKFMLAALHKAADQNLLDHTVVLELERQLHLIADWDD